MDATSPPQQAVDPISQARTGWAERCLPTGDRCLERCAYGSPQLDSSPGPAAGGGFL